MRPRMLGDEDLRESRRVPACEHPVQLAGLVRRIDEGNVVTIRRECGGELDGVTLEDARPLTQTERGDVRAKRMKARWSELHEVRALCASRQGLESERPATREEVEDPRVPQVGLEHREHRVSHMLGRRANA